MRLLIAALAVGLTMASAQAQVMAPNGAQMPASGIGAAAEKAAQQGSKSPAEVKSDERAYNSALHNLPDKQFDPWRGVR